MKTKKIKIASKEVTLAYCFATEVNFKLLADIDINEFIVEVADAISADRLPDIRKTIFLILSAAQAYCDEKDEELKIIDKDVLYHCSPIELGTAIGTIVKLRSEFFQIPTGEPKPKKERKSGKNS